jgi:hypothetical protein
MLWCTVYEWMEADAFNDTTTVKDNEEYKAYV